MSEQEAKIVGVTPFHTSPESPDHIDKQVALQETVRVLSEVVDQVFVINDGIYGFRAQGSTTLSQQHSGKAEAVRFGLAQILDQDSDVGFIIQTDSDLDQRPIDARLFLEFIEEHHITPQQPYLIIGDRYFQGQADNSPHRQAMLKLQQAFSLALGFPDARDFVSGFRAYTKAFAQQFTDLSIAPRYGIEAEQMIIANLIGAQVTSVPLTYSRPRDPQTLTSKFLDTLDSIALHGESLRNKGLVVFVDFFSAMKHKMEHNEGSFVLNLEQIGGESSLLFQRVDNAYASKVLD